MFASLSDKTVFVIYRIAKHPTKGVRPFFKHPKLMIELRDEFIRRGGKC